MRILLTTDTFYPMINGVVISTNNLYKELKYRGHDVRIMTLSDSGEEKIDGDIYYLRALNVNIYPGAKVRVPFTGKLIKEIIRWRPEIIHSQTEFSTFVSAKYIAKKLSIPHIHTYHTLYEDYLGYIFGGKIIRPKTAALITKMLLNKTDGIVVPTKKVKTVIESYGIGCKKHIIPTGINVDKFYRDISQEEKNELLNKLQLNGDNKILVYIGRIAEEKNIQEIINYVSKLKSSNLNVKLLIVGGGPYLDKLRHRALECDSQENVCFAGMVRPEEVYKYYQLGSIFVTASTSETQGLTYIEAMASGLPIVCRYDPCVEDLGLDGETGFTYKDENEFRNAVARLLRDEKFRSCISQRARIKAEKYSSQTFGKKAEELYLKCCCQRKDAKIRRWFSVSIIKNKGLAS